MSVFKKFILFISACYGIQFLIVSFCYIVPCETKEYKGKEYQIKRGFPGGTNYMPLVGLLSMIGPDPCYLVVKDIQTGKETMEGGYDIPSDVYYDYEDVWPEETK